MKTLALASLMLVMGTAAVADEPKPEGTPTMEVLCRQYTTQFTDLQQRVNQSLLELEQIRGKAQLSCSMAPQPTPEKAK